MRRTGAPGAQPPRGTLAAPRLHLLRPPQRLAQESHQGCRCGRWHALPMHCWRRLHDARHGHWTGLLECRVLPVQAPHGRWHGWQPLRQAQWLSVQAPGLPGQVLIPCLMQSVQGWHARLPRCRALQKPLARQTRVLLRRRLLGVQQNRQLQCRRIGGPAVGDRYRSASFGFAQLRVARLDNWLLTKKGDRLPSQCKGLCRPRYKQQHKQSSSLHCRTEQVKTRHLFYHERVRRTIPALQC